MFQTDAKKEPQVSKHAEAQESPNSQGFVFDRVLFQEMGNDSIRCGVCQKEYTRLVVHLNSSGMCNKNFDMVKLRTELAPVCLRKAPNCLRFLLGRTEEVSKIDPLYALHLV